MGRLRPHLHASTATNKSGTRNYLLSTMALLAVSAVLLGFRVWEPIWPLWLVENRNTFIGLALLGHLCLVFAYPVMIEADAHPRHLSGPGRNPKTG